MNNTILRNPASRSKGITLIEILLVLGLLVLLLSFAMPSVGGAASKAEMKAAVENVRYSLDTARKTARMTETGMSVHISPEDQGAVRTISFSSSSEGNSGGSNLLQDYRLPPEIVLVSDHQTYRFDERGLVENPGRILLVSATDESVTSTINVR